MRQPAHRLNALVLGLLALALGSPSSLLAGIGGGAAKGLGRVLGKGATKGASSLVTKSATKGAASTAATLAAKSGGKAATRAAKPVSKLGKAGSRTVAASTHTAGLTTRAGAGSTSALGQGEGLLDEAALRASLANRGILGNPADRIIRRETAKAARQRAAREAAERAAVTQGGRLEAKRVRSVEEWIRRTRGPGKGPVPAPDELVGFPGLVRARGKTSVQGGGGVRKRWKDRKGQIFEWDSQHGAVERYTSNGRHLGEFDAWTGRMTKGPDLARSVEP